MRYSKTETHVTGLTNDSIPHVSIDGGAERKKTRKDLEEIEKLNWGEESRLEVEQKIEELKERIAISDKNTEKQLHEQKKELGAQEKAL